MKIAISPTLTMFVAAFSMSGCASIVSGTQQSISVTAKTPESVDVSGASCSFENGKGRWFAPAPGSVTVHRAYTALVVHCDHPDWVGDTEAKSTTKGMAFGNILFGGVIGVGIDAGTGAAYDYPQLITVPMKARVAVAPAAAAGGAMTSPVAAIAAPVQPPTAATAAPVAVVVSQSVPAAAPSTNITAVSAAAVPMPAAAGAAIAVATTPPPTNVTPVVPPSQGQVAARRKGDKTGFQRLAWLAIWRVTPNPTPC